MHTLVVDDEERVRFFLERTMRLDGHTVATAAGGEDALEQLRESSFESVMLERMLGGRVDGMLRQVVKDVLARRAGRSRAGRTEEAGEAVSYGRRR